MKQTRQTEIEFFDFDDFERLVDGARKVGPAVLAFVLLAGEAGLRRGKISVAPIIKHPDVAGGLHGGEVEIAGLDVVGRRGSRCRTEARVVQVEDGTRRPRRTLGRRIDPLDPRAECAIAKREVIDQRAIRRPTRMASMIRYDGHPLRWDGSDLFFWSLQTRHPGLRCSAPFTRALRPR
jgi:hypothetical protein